MKAYEVKKMMSDYSANATLKEIFEDFERPHKCPQCKGTGFYSKKNSSSLPKWVTRFWMGTRYGQV